MGNKIELFLMCNLQKSCKKNFYKQIRIPTKINEKTNFDNKKDFLRVKFLGLNLNKSIINTNNKYEQYKQYKTEDGRVQRNDIIIPKFVGKTFNSSFLQLKKTV